MILTRRMLAKGHIPGAYRRVAANELSSGALYVEVEWLSGWIALRHLDKPKTAREHFARIVRRVNYPIIKARAAYWAGRAAAVAGDRKHHSPKQAGMTHNYYGQLAAARIGGRVRLISASIEPTDSDISTFNRDERVHAVKMRNQIGARDYIQPFVRALLGGTTNPVRQFLTANLATEIDRRDIAVRAVRKAYRTGSPLPEIAYHAERSPGTGPSSRDCPPGKQSRRGGNLSRRRPWPDAADAQHRAVGR